MHALLCAAILLMGLHAAAAAPTAGGLAGLSSSLPAGIGPSLDADAPAMSGLAGSATAEAMTTLPEPASLVVLGLGLVAFGVLRVKST